MYRIKRYVIRVFCVLVVSSLVATLLPGWGRGSGPKSYVSLTKWEGEDSGDGRFRLPFGVAVDSSGYVYVADTKSHCIQKFTSDGKFVTKWGR